MWGTKESISTRGMSVIDYILVPFYFLPQIVNFRVGYPQSSDHLPLTCDLAYFSDCHHNCHIQVEDGHPDIIKRIKWDADTKESFYALLQTEGVFQLSTLDLDNQLRIVTFFKVLISTLQNKLGRIPPLQTTERGRKNFTKIEQICLTLKIAVRNAYNKF